jgi:hypothetical protein
MLREERLMYDLVATIFHPDDQQGPAQKSKNVVPVISALAYSIKIGILAHFRPLQYTVSNSKIKLQENNFCKIKVICWDMAQREITTANDMNDGFICLCVNLFLSSNTRPQKS